MFSNEVSCTCILPAARPSVLQIVLTPSCAFSALLVQHNALSARENALCFVASHGCSHDCFVHGLSAYQRAEALGNIRTITEPFKTFLWATTDTCDGSVHMWLRPSKSVSSSFPFPFVLTALTGGGGETISI